MAIYSWSTTLVKMNFMGKRFCSADKGFTDYYLFKEVFRITIFRMPIFWHTKKYYVLCQNCKNGYVVSKDTAFAIEQEFSTLYPEQYIEQVLNYLIETMEHEQAYTSTFLLCDIKEKFHIDRNEKYFQSLIESIQQCYQIEKVDA